MDSIATSAVRPRYASIPKGADYLGISRSKMYAEKKAGRIKFVKFGAATRVEYDELDRYADEVATPAAT